MLKLNDDEAKSCPFVSSEGCTIYNDRPWPCRMYPLGIASPKENGNNGDEEFFFIMEEPVCQGYYEEKNQTVNDWLKEQQVEEYTEMGDRFKEVTLHDYFKEGKKLNPAKLEMFYTVCYNVDKFREFVFESTFLKRFEVDEYLLDRMKKDDEELLLFGFEWLKFCLYGEKTMKVRKTN
jgi:uncharacterized protein